MGTIGATVGTIEPDLTICPRLSMYCKQSRRRNPSHGLCSISYTTPSNFEVLLAIAESISAGENEVRATCPASSALMTLLRRGISAIQAPFYATGRAVPV